MSFEHEAVRGFADSITPPNWNVALHPRGYCYKPGTLNVWLQILSFREAAQYFAVEGPFMGRVWGPMWFTRLSSIKGGIPEAKQAFEKYGDGSVGLVHIQLCPHMGDLPFIVIHELAHVAVTRCKSRKLRPHKGDNVFVVDDSEEQKHQDPLFQKALFRLISRAEAVYGRSAGTEAIWKAYRGYVGIEREKNRTKSFGRQRSIARADRLKCIKAQLI
jgi:hypothetical protein